MVWERWIWPVAITDGREPVVSDHYQRYQSADHRMHSGADIMFKKRPGDPPDRVRHTASLLYIAPQGTKILAAGPGKIWSTGSTERGLNILIDHGNVHGFGPMTTWYQHLAAFSRNWKKGDEVQPGTVLGDMGYSSAEGEQLRHLHFEIRNPTSSIDPEPYLDLWRKTGAVASRGGLSIPIALGAGAGLLVLGIIIASTGRDELA